MARIDLYTHILYTYYVCIFAQNDMIGRVQYVKHILMILRSQRTQCNMELVGKGAPAATQFKRRQGYPKEEMHWAMKINHWMWGSLW